MAEPRSGALLVNLGTPDSPSVADVRRYLREFLSDPRVVDIPAAARWLLLHAVILRIRPRRSARAYAQVWTPEGSPLLVHSRALRDAVALELGDAWEVALGMRYGRPSIATAVAQLADAKVSRVVVLPLFPQYAEASTGSALARVEQELQRAGLGPAAKTIRSFHSDPGFIDCVANPARDLIESAAPDWVLFSYHGLPARQARAVDPRCLASNDCCSIPDSPQLGCYRAQCLATSRELARALDLQDKQHSTAFQSRMGLTPWIQPATPDVLVDLAARGVRRLLVICPSFTADCLETLEEISIRERDRWRVLGGDELIAAPCPNATPAWSRAVAKLLTQPPP